MQRAVCLAKFKCYSDVQYITNYGMGHCASQWNLRHLFINSNCINYASANYLNLRDTSS